MCVCVYTFQASAGPGHSLFGVARALEPLGLTGRAPPLPPSVPPARGSLKAAAGHALSPLRLVCHFTGQQQSI